MKPERSFIADRALAQHCPELIRSGSADSAPAELLPALSRVGTKLSRVFAAALSPLTGGQEVVIQVGAPREVTAAALVAEIAPLAANSLLSLGNASLLASFDAGAVLRMIDRAFGGKGQTPAPLPATFPASAGVVIRQLEAMIAEGFATATGASLEPVRRHGNLAELDAYPDAVQLVVLTLTVSEVGAGTWPILVAVPLAALAGLVADGGQAPTRAAASRQTNPAEEPYCDLPLTLSAVIVDMRLPMSALTQLQPGSLLPVSVARNVPLRIGDKTIAHGAIGSVDDRVAIQITQAF
ncbi:MAG: flagellar switch protein [Novosphingobium sp.]|nr:flagellar switch protein [Novosphingobium sp.]